MKLRGKCELDVAVAGACDACRPRALLDPDPALYLLEARCWSAERAVRNYRARLLRWLRRKGAKP